MANNISLHIYPSVFGHESRIQKETKSLVDGGFFDKIFIIALWESGIEEHEHLDDKREVWRVRLKTSALPESTFWKIIKHIEWVLKIFLRFRKSSIKFVNCHNLSTLPIGILFKLFLKSKVVYDTHELETERNGWSRTRKAMAKILERSLIHKVDIVIVVSESIAKWYRNRYCLKNVYTIYNYPDKRVINGEPHSRILKNKYNIKSDQILYIYQGLLGGGRCTEILLNVFSKVEKKKHIVFMGHGNLVNTIKKYENDYPNIHFQPSVKPEEVVKYTSSADVGFVLAKDNTCLSYVYSLGNKFFEYILSGLPIITNDFLLEMANLIDKNEWGWKVTSSEQSIIDLIESISKKDINEKRKNVLKCKDNFTWDKEEVKLLNIYGDLNKK